MRLRESNRQKRFLPPSVDSDQDDGTSDDAFVVEVGSYPGDLVDHDSDSPASSDFESADGRQARPARNRTKKSRPSASTTDRSLREVRLYPTDASQKWTRSYVGPVKRWTRLVSLVDFWFGDRDDRQRIFDDFISLWWNMHILPPKLLPGSSRLARARDGWMPDGFAQNQQEKIRIWYQRYLSTRPAPQTSALIDEAAAFRWFLPQADGEMSVLLGHVTDQKKYFIQQGESIPLVDSGLPVDGEDEPEPQNAGWLLDVGGIVLSMGWAPIRGQADQLLALAVVPFSDQAPYQDPDIAPVATEIRGGGVQVWKFEAEENSRGVFRPARSSPRLARVVGFRSLRVMRLQWCPVPLAGQSQVGLLAVLCNDGKVRVVRIGQDPATSTTGAFEDIQEPMITIEPPREYTLEINCFTWINMNRIAVGLSDGSVAVWSLSPCRQMQRHPVHSSPIMDMVSSYPSHPFLIATLPLGGVFTLTDLNRPSAERTYHTNMTISLQPNALGWSDHLRGYVSVWPSSFPATSTVSFVQSRVFPLSRHICTHESQTTCLAIGACHPFILVGCSDGSVWALNVLRKIASHRQTTYKIRVFQHEYIPSPPPNSLGGEEIPRRGACRILHGFLAEPNTHPIMTRIAKKGQMKHAQAGKGAADQHNDEGSAKKGKSNKKTAQKPGGAGSDDPAEIDEDNFTMVAGPIVVHEPLSRITAVSWNPNAEFSWWAAAAMGSGLVRVMDLGIEAEDTEGQQHEQIGLGGEGDVAGSEPGNDDTRYEDEMEDGDEGDDDMSQ
ncbi:WD40 repeat-like protein [Durotheca rogersii]|uniref:WD40 repeat-like protein n=1 Tax=Durotheca rogersii TaxID=419775 RepID=UPI00221FB527|nr:WD40 repeat-like protein [Durotheca rogersii]KAI5866417.1 WD40 repeat-like protein [Durotheca rogersii]